ncbi:MAG: hypothetical protein JWL81_791 [Verrucomicrobiales bacterium]|nr:hypothetical protein [Verrucomicrobiales bacterium]
MSRYTQFINLFFLCNVFIINAGAATALFLGTEVASGTDPAADPQFGAWLGTAELVSSDIVNYSAGSGPHKAVWGKINAAAAGVTTYTMTWAASGGATPVDVPVTITGWDNTTGALTTPSGTAALSTFGLGTTTLQAGAPRPSFASGSGSGYYIGTESGSTSDKIRNAVQFDLSGFAGGGLYSFGIFGGDLETGDNINATGAVTGSVGVRGFLLLTFEDSTTQRIDYAPTAALAAAATFTGNNHTNAGYGNETGRFIGLASDDKRITSAVFVVGDDDKIAASEGNGDSEQLGFIAPVTFLESNGQPHVPTSVPEVSGVGLMLGAAGWGVLGRRRRERGRR